MYDINLQFNNQIEKNMNRVKRKTILSIGDYGWSPPSFNNFFLGIFNKIL